MNYSTAVFLINKHVRCILATYEADEKAKRTQFKTLDDAIKIGDFVIVPTDTRHKMTVCKVVDVDVDVDFDSQEQMQWVIGIVDLADHSQVLSQEAKAIQTIKSAELREKRTKLADALFANTKDDLKTLEIADMNGGTEKPAA